MTTLSQQILESLLNLCSFADLGDNMQLWSDNILSPSQNVRRWFIVGLVLLPLAMTASGIRADYVGDAWKYARPDAWRGLKGYLTTERTVPGIYRPLADLAVITEYRVFGTNPVVPRAVRFAIYSATCLLVFLILEALSQSFLIGAVSALIFTVMPSHVPSAFQIGQTVTVSAVFFSLSAFWLAGPAYHRKPSRLKVLLACVAYIAGLLSYEFTVFTPLFLFVFELFWGSKEGWAAIKRHIVKAHLWLWVITMIFGCLKIYQLSRLTGWTYGDLSRLTAAEVMKRFVPLFYGTTCPLQLSPALSIAALVLLGVSLKSDWRLGLFLVIWVIVAPALSYPQELVYCYRVYLASFGTAGLLGYVTVSCLGAALDVKSRSSRASALVSFLDWVVVISISYWVFELFRASWVEFFSQQPVINHPRFWVASITAIALLSRCAISKSVLPTVSRVPLRALSAGLIVLIVGFYAGGFLKVMAASVAESDDAAKLPEAIIAVKPQVPDNTLILVVFDGSVPIEEEETLCASLRSRLRAEYGKDWMTLGAASFRAWTNSFQYNAIAPETTFLAFRYDGKKAVEDPELVRHILKRQQSYLALRSDVIHAQATVASTANSALLRLEPEVDSMLIDKAQLHITHAPVLNLKMRLEFTSNGRTGSLELPAHIEGTEATVVLDREPQWVLAGRLSEVRILVLAGPSDFSIDEARLVQTKGRISETPLPVLPDGPSPTIAYIPPLPLTHVLPICFPVKDVAGCVALP